MKKVLVIDDQSDVLMIIGETLKYHGFATLLAGDGETGIEMARRERPDLIICDVNMPNLDGYETLTRLRQDENTATTPFIFLSGAVERPSVRLGMELGADDYLTKPFLPSELMAAVNTRLGKQEVIARQTEKKLDELRGNITLALPHELRTPLNGIMGLSAMLMEDFAAMPPAEIQETAGMINESALRLHHLIENFLIYAQIEMMAGDDLLRQASASRTEVAPIVNEVVGDAAAKSNRAGDLTLSVQPATVAVIGDNLQKITGELVDNAFKFSSPGSPVRVTGTVVDKNYELAIADSGRGMTAEQIASIAPQVQFERNIYEQQGAGLGLIIAKRLTELQGGKLSIESVPGRQTTVRVTFPLSS